MHKNILNISEALKPRRKASNSSSRLYKLKIELNPSYNPNFSELFYRRARSLRKLFGIKQDLKIPSPIIQSKTPDTLNSPKDPIKILPPTIKFSFKRKDLSTDSYKKLVSDYFSNKQINDSLISAKKKARVKNNVSANAKRKNNSNNLRQLPSIYSSKPNLFLAEDRISGW